MTSLDDMRRQLRERYENMKRKFRYIPEQRLEKVISAVKPLIASESNNLRIPVPKFRKVNNIAQTIFPFPWIYKPYVYAAYDPKTETIIVARSVPYPNFYVESELISSILHEWVHHRQLYWYADGKVEKYQEDYRDDPAFFEAEAEGAEQDLMHRYYYSSTSPSVWDRLERMEVW